MKIAAVLAAALVATLGIAAQTASAADAGAVKTLRGDTPIGSEASPGNFRQERDHMTTPRDYVQQPPLIPHTINNYQITKNFNKCMDCHAWNKATETKATKVSLTHFKDREGQELSNVSPRRYFCTQCHVPQTDATPLVGNTFQRAEGLR
ncbi:MAG: nitrate reductase cytochrome c-type subunit [Rhodocyclaceae bacterium]|nr:nitrate reductase cytochrome c-type subunit [Rhodocyclaceae bacterium]